MPRALRWSIATLVALAPLAACGGGDGDDGVDETAPEFGGAAEVASALEVAGLGCDDYQPFGADGEVIVETPFEDASAEQGRCTLVGNLFTTIAYFDSLDDQREYRELGETMGCDLLAAEGVTELVYVVGNRWTVEPGSDDDMIDRITDEVGGRRSTIDC